MDPKVSSARPKGAREYPFSIVPSEKGAILSKQLASDVSLYFIIHVQ